jgi:hypothetical protein
MSFNIGDKVTYVGQKFTKELSSKIGEVVGRVQNASYEVVVDFGDGDYVMPESCVSRYRGVVKEENDFEIRRRARFEKEEV